MESIGIVIDAAASQKLQCILAIVSSNEARTDTERD